MDTGTDNLFSLSQKIVRSPPALFRNLFDSRKIQFRYGVTDKKNLPNWGLAEVAFAGRSNVGKSSLLNALCGIKIARTSKNPGCTRQINFFDMNHKSAIVDLPGYGYAVVSKQERALWADIITSYLINRPNLKLVVVLVDSRHELKQLDIDMIRFLCSQGLTYKVVLTKCDKVKATALESRVNELNSAKFGSISQEEVTAVSVINRTGIVELGLCIANLII